MPDTYAHYRFGRDVLAALPEGEQAIIRKNRRLYDIGLHGPDPLFYYYPLTHHPLHKVGSRMHETSGLDYFTSASLAFCSRGEPHPDRAYLYGFLCHYALDSTCHGYIDKTSEESIRACLPADSGAALPISDEDIPPEAITHSDIEISFDRELMVMDGIDPIREDRARSLRMSPGEARRCAAVMAPYFPGVTAGQLRTSLFHMALVVRLLRTPEPASRHALERAVHAMGKDATLRGHLVPPEPDSRCFETDVRLLELYNEALPLAVRLIKGFSACARGQAPWPDCCRRSFGSEIPGAPAEKAT